MQAIIETLVTKLLAIIGLRVGRLSRASYTAK
jgi:hypothetical protein